MDENVRAEILAELVERLGSREQFVRLSARAGVPIIAVSGASTAIQYEHMIQGLWEQGPEALFAYLDAAAVESGGGFEVRWRLVGSRGGWEMSDMRTTMLRLPPQELIDAASAAAAGIERAAEPEPVSPEPEPEPVSPEPEPERVLPEPEPAVGIEVETSAPLALSPQAPSAPEPVPAVPEPEPAIGIDAATSSAPELASQTPSVLEPEPVVPGPAPAVEIDAATSSVPEPTSLTPSEPEAAPVAPELPPAADAATPSAPDLTSLAPSEQESEPATPEHTAGSAVGPARPHHTAESAVGPVASTPVPPVEADVNQRLREMAADIGLVAERWSVGGILPAGARPAGNTLKLIEAWLVENRGDGGNGTLCLEGQAFKAPAFLEVEGFPGNRLIERVQPGRAHALVSERDHEDLLNRRVRMVQGGRTTEWVGVRPGGDAHRGDPWPVFPPEVAYVPAGEYQLPGESSRRRLERGVLLSLFPVTTREMLSFVEETGYVPELPEDFLKHRRAEGLPEALLDHPVIYVNQADALAYCRWAGGILPTVEMWERAAIGVTGDPYPWGAEFDRSRLNSRESRRGWTTSIHSFPEGRGPYGHLNLAGNVWEWTSSPARDDAHAILKGGSWVNDRNCAANAYRATHRRELRGFFIGFRVAYELPPGVVG